jgi:hypothetical protein
MSNLLTITNLSRITIYFVIDNNCNKNSIILPGCTKITKERTIFKYLQILGTVRGIQ